MNGHGGSEFGVMHAAEIIRKLSAPIAEFYHKVLLISINRSVNESTLYEATRHAWRLNVKKASQAEIILPTVQGLIVGAFIAEKWLEATGDNFLGTTTIEGRYGFVGKEAPIELKNLYVGKRIPNQFSKKGASNPIRYTW